jgi:signal transduction histidine kinase
MEEGKIHPEYKFFDLYELADEVTNDMRITAKDGQKIIYTHEGNTNVYLDNKLLRNIFINLISNAIKFTDENKSILLKTVVTADNALIEIEDHGIGISEDDQKHLFERFFRGSNVLNIQGTGLGLHIVGNFVDILKGHITLSSKLNIGTIIKINFPLGNESSK